MSGVIVEQEDARELNLTVQLADVTKQFVEDPAFVTGYFGPFGCAKTTALCLKAWAYAYANPGARILIARDTWPNLRDTTQKTFFQWFPDGVAGRYEVQRKTFYLAHPSGTPGEIIFRAMEDRADLTNVLSLDLAAAALDEPQGGVTLRGEQGITHEPGINFDLYQGIKARAGRQAGGYPPMVWMGGNPPDPSHWIAREFRYTPGASGHDAPTNERVERIELFDGTLLDVAYHLYLGDQTTNRANLELGYYERLEADYGRETPMALRFLRGLWIPFATTKPFRLDHLVYWGDPDEDDHEANPLPRKLEVEAGFDPAISKKDTANYSGLVVGGQSRANDLSRGRIYMLEAIKGHWSVYEQVGQILAAHRRWNLRRIRIENVAYQGALADVLEREARLAGLTVTVQLCKADLDKLRRANAWAGLVESGTVLFGRGTCQPLIKAMLAVPEDEGEWDLVDAAGLCIRGDGTPGSGFPRLDPAQVVLPDAASTQGQERARGYAVRPPLEAEAPAPPPRPRYAGENPDTRKRAVGYAIRPQ